MKKNIVLLAASAISLALMSGCDRPTDKLTGSAPDAQDRIVRELTDDERSAITSIEERAKALKEQYQVNLARVHERVKWVSIIPAELLPKSHSFEVAQVNQTKEGQLLLVVDEPYVAIPIDKLNGFESEGFHYRVYQDDSQLYLVKTTL